MYAQRRDLNSRHTVTWRSCMMAVVAALATAVEIVPPTVVSSFVIEAATAAPSSSDVTEEIEVLMQLSAMMPISS